jgi:hypothetical protein
MARRRSSAGAFLLHLHVGDAVAQRLEGGEGDAELLARVHVLHSQLHRLVDRPDALRAGGGDADVHAVLQCVQAILRHGAGRAVAERHFGGAAAILRAVAARGHARRRALHEKEAERPVHHRRHQVSVGLVPRRDDAFRPGHGPVIAIARGRRVAHVEPVPRPAFLVSQHHQCLPAGDPRQPLRLEGLGCVAAQHAARDQGLRQRLQHHAAPEFLHHDHAFDRAHSHAAVFLGDVEAGQAKIGKLGVCRAVESAGLDGLAAPLEVVALVDPLADGVTQLFLVVGKIKVHSCLLNLLSEHRLRDDVALHFVAAAVDRRLAQVEVC